MSRFQGKTGKRLLLEALRQQQTFGCSPALISKIAHAAKVKNARRNSQLIIEGSDDNKIAFILRGAVDILVKGQKVAHRIAGQHVGEMSVIDPKARRSATVVASEDTEVAWIEESDFSRIARAHPELWRALAVEIANRLRQRAALLRDQNERPSLFIGSSSESLRTAKALQRALDTDPINITLWNRGVFGASEATIESLEKVVRNSDFAILVFSADDKVHMRQKHLAAPRDNVVFELGLFMGAIGRKRTIILAEANSKLRIPSDLSGITRLMFHVKNKKLVTKDIDVAVSEIRKRISEMNVR